MTIPAREELTEYLDPEIISRIGRLDLVARFVVEGFITGLHRSPYHGFSVEFSEHRPYMPGDPLRDVDWKALAKTDRLYVKRYEEETNVKAYLLLDVSGSMDFQSGGAVTKSRYARCLAASLAHLMLRQRDAVGLMLFCNRILSLVRPRSVQSHLHVLLREMAQVQPQADTHMGQAFHDLAERLPRRGLVIVLSDLLDEPDEVLSGLRHFRHRGHEVIVFHLLDPRERDLAFQRGDTSFLDLEQPGQVLVTQPWHMQEQYREMMADLERVYARRCAEARIDYTLIDTATSFDVALSQYLVQRRRMS